jgi:hypothetical protein
VIDVLVENGNEHTLKPSEAEELVLAGVVYLCTSTHVDRSGKCIYHLQPGKSMTDFHAARRA